MSRAPAPVVTSPRLAERRRAVRRARMRRRRRVVATLVVMATFGVSLWAFAQSSFFALTRVEVKGLRTLSAAEVTAASGLRAGDNILALDAAAVAARVRTLQPVRDARVERVGSSVVRITVAERRPAILLVAGEARAFMDRDGVRVEGPRRVRRGVLPVLRLAPPAQQPVSAAATGTEGAGEPPPAVVPDPDPALVRGVLSIWRSFTKAERARIAWFEATDAGLTFRFDDAVVVFGPAARVSQKVAAVRAVVARAAEEDATVRRLDVRAPLRPAAVIR